MQRLRVVTPKLTQQIQKLAKGAPAASDAQKALNIAGNTPQISNALKGVVTNSMIQGPGVAGYSTKVVQRMKNVGVSIVDRYRPRNLAETLGYDALATFMVSGEGVLDFDETVSDFAMEVGIPYFPALTTSAEDSAFAIKLKQVAEGLPISAAMQPLIDMWTIGRFAKRIKNADPKLKEQLLEQFSLEANQLGVSVAKVYTGQYVPQFGPAQARQVDFAGTAPAGRPFDVPVVQDGRDPFDRAGDIVPYQAQPGGALARLVDDTVRQQNLRNAELTEMVSPASDRFLRKDDPFIDDELATTRPSNYTGGPQSDLSVIPARVEVDPGAGALPGGPSRLETPALKEAVDEVPIQIPEPDPFDLPDGPVTNIEWKTPGEIGDAFAEDAATAFRQSIELQQPGLPGENFLEAATRIKRLMPQTRVEALDYLAKNAPTVNGSGVLSASDSVWTNFIINRGRKEGWIQIDENFNFTTTREVARNLDAGTSAQKAAKNVDEVVQLEELEATTGVDTRLGQIEANRAADVERVKSADVMQREAARVAPREPGEATDRQLIQDVLGLDVDEVVDLYIEKAPQGRKHQVVRSDGTVVGQFTRRTQAEKYVQQQAKKVTDDLVRRAKQTQADATPQRLDIGDAVGRSGTDEPLVGRLKFTQVQKNVLAEFSDEMGALLNADSKRKTYDFSYYEMEEFMNGLRYMVDSGEFKGNKLRVLRNLLNKIETAKAELDPIAQARAKADDLSRLSSREMDHNDYCF